MNTILRLLHATILATLLCPAATNAQERPIGQWRSHLPYNSAVSVATDGVRIYTATQHAFFIYDLLSNEVSTYSKVDGMSDVGMSYIAFDHTTGTAVLAYDNSNIDLFKNGSFFNIPDLKLRNVTGDKSIYHIYTEDGLAYLSTGVGIIVINLAGQEVKETYTFSINNETIPVKGLTIAGNYFYAIANTGLYKADKNNPNLQAFSEWQQLEAQAGLISIASSGGKVFVATRDTLFAVENDTLTFVRESLSNIRHVDRADGFVWLSESYGSSAGIIKKILLDNSGSQEFSVSTPQQVVEAGGGAWIASEELGLRKAGDDNAFNTPEGPADIASYDIFAYNRNVLVAHGGYDDTWKFLGKTSGFSEFKDGDWKTYTQHNYPPFKDKVYDISVITKSLADGTIYAGSNNSGLFILKEDGSHEFLDENSVFDESVTAPGKRRISGLAIDDQNNLWINVYGGFHELVAKTDENNWIEYRVLPMGRPISNAAANILIDEQGIKWYVAPPGNGGLIAYYDNGTIENPQDDTYTQMLAGEGQGNLPSSDVYSIAEDKDGSIWVGTGDGIGIINCGLQIFEGTCEAERPIVQFDQFAGYLFQNERVRAIAVDGGNRKWVGTNNGVWLLSPEGDKIIERFTIENSPLPSNNIQKITIDPVTGDVYIGTEQGLVSYRGTATDGGSKNEDVLTFPNPVPSGYGGTIAIRGLVENADVRITDISGQLVYRTKANGGQAVWNGLDYTGRRPQSGVYLIFATNKDGTETHAGKMVFME